MIVGPMALLESYQPLYVIGRGGMGTIELALERASGTSGPRVVALKRMLPAVRDREHEGMFLREARLATLLNHPNVVHAFAFGEHDGELIIAMEYVEGETVARLASRSRLPLDVVALVLAEVCDGLEAAHELQDVGGKPLGVVHRDVSPHNVMLSYRGEVKLLDFGVAKLESAHLTKTGDVKGKVAYMSPEQAMSEPLDRRSDLYGVGAILFELVAGRRMWPGESDIDVLRSLALGATPSLAEAAPDAPSALAELFARLVAKKPSDRPSSAAEVAAALRAFGPDATAARASLVALLSGAFPDAASEKRRKVAAALSSRDEAPAPSGAMAVPSAPPHPSRVAPWIYALGGALVASAAVLGIAHNRVATQAPAAPIVSAPPSVSAAPAPRSFEIIAPEDTAAPARPRPRVHAPPEVLRRAREPKPAASSSAARPPIDVDRNPI